MLVIRLLGLIIGLISIVLTIISVAIPYWIYVADTEGNWTYFNFTHYSTGNIGFWEYCLSFGFAGSSCVRIYESDRTDMTDASAAMLLLGMLLMGGSVVVCGISLLCMKESKLFPIVGGTYAFLAGTCTLIGVALFGYEHWQKSLFIGFSRTVPGMYGPSFYMAIVATFFALVSGGLQIANSCVSNVCLKPNGINS